MITLLAAVGCSSGSSPSNVAVGAITFTDVNGTALAVPPASLNTGQSAYLDVTLTNDPQNLGADWSVYCGSAPPPGTPPPPGQTQDESCGTFTPVHTMSGPVPSYVFSGSGYVTLYTAPAALPKQGAVTLYAASASNPSRSSSATLTITALPISVNLAPAPPATLDTGATTQLKAVVENDSANAGVSWSTLCASSDCGSFTPAKTASGVATTYTAPASAPDGGTVQVIATSVTDPTKSASATITIAAANAGAISGSVRAAQQRVAGARMALYSATTGETPLSPLNATITDEDGNFAFPEDYRCPAPESQMYVVAVGGNAGGGENPTLVLMAALGDCGHIMVNEATTVAAVYALSPFMTGAGRVGSPHTSAAALTSAFATAHDLVDVATGAVRTRTVLGTGIVPQAKIDSIANLLSACARTAGSSPGDGSACDRLFAATNPGADEASRPADTLQALLNLARNATGFPRGEPRDWTLAIAFPAGTGTREYVPSIDAAGNVWIGTNDGGRAEFVGGAACAGAPRTLLPIAAGLTIVKPDTN